MIKLQVVVEAESPALDQTTLHKLHEVVEDLIRRIAVDRHFRIGRWEEGIAASGMSIASSLKRSSRIRSISRFIVSVLQ
jgi:hypothetical protein